MAMLVLIFTVFVAQSLAQNSTGAPQSGSPGPEEKSPKCFGSPFGSNDNASNPVTRLSCYHVGADGKSLGEVLQGQITRFNAGGEKQDITLDKIMQNIRHLHVSARKGGNITVAKGDLSKFGSLKQLEFSGEGEADLPTYGLKFDSPDELANIPSLHHLTLRRLDLDPSAVKALDNLKDKIAVLVYSEVTPSGELVKSLSKFTNLTHISLVSECGAGPIPEDTFQASADKLRFIDVFDCQHSKLTSAYFSKMPNLKKLSWSISKNLQIEPGTFDGLTNLQEVQLIGDRITHLPPGIFDKNTNLNEVKVFDNEDVFVDNLSIANFTQAKNLTEQNLILKTPEIVLIAVDAVPPPPRNATK